MNQLVKEDGSLSLEKFGEAIDGYIRAKIPVGMDECGPAPMDVDALQKGFKGKGKGPGEFPGKGGDGGKGGHGGYNLYGHSYYKDGKGKGKHSTPHNSSKGYAPHAPAKGSKGGKGGKS